MYSFSEQEIALLAKEKAQIMLAINSVNALLDDQDPNVQILQLYKERKTEYDRKLAYLRELELEQSSKRIQYDLLKEKRQIQFKEGFDEIARHVKQIYRLITNGGDADLETIDQLDPFSEGVLF